MINIDDLLIKELVLSFDKGSVQISFCIHEHNESVNRPILKGYIIDHDSESKDRADLVDQIRSYFKSLIAQGAKVQ